MSANQESINQATWRRFHDAANSGDVDLIARTMCTRRWRISSQRTTRSSPGNRPPPPTEASIWVWPPTGRPVAYDEMFVARFTDGRIAELWGVVDVFAQLRQLGARFV